MTRRSFAWSSRELADLIEKDCPAVGQFEAPGLRRDRVRKRAPLATEQFAFDERSRQRRAIDVHEATATTCAPLVEGARQKSLSGSGFSEEEHGRVGRGDYVDLLHDQPERLAGAEQNTPGRP
jgi:hypothetical protein